MGSRSIMSSPSLQYQENHYSNDAVEKANENREKHGNSTLDHFLRKDEDDFNFSDRRVKQCVGKTMRLAFISILIRLLGPQFAF